MIESWLNRRDHCIKDRDSRYQLLPAMMVVVLLPIVNACQDLQKEAYIICFSQMEEADF
jgi:hypothetical protein